MTEQTLETLRNMVKIQGTKGTWNTGEYAWGMYNGMELMLATIEDRSPNFREWEEFKNAQAKN